MKKQGIPDELKRIFLLKLDQRKVRERKLFTPFSNTEVDKSFHRIVSRILGVGNIAPNAHNPMMVFSFPLSSSSKSSSFIRQHNDLKFSPSGNALQVKSSSPVLWIVFHPSSYFGCCCCQFACQHSFVESF